MVLTGEQRLEFVEARDKYELLKSEIEIKRLIHVKALSNLEDELRKSMPVTPNGKAICKYCGIESMEYLRRVPIGEGPFGGKDLYRCEICGYKHGDIFE
ncbi:MAG: hypothetical protein WAU65_03085 [Candidatus Nanoarchaeia archaeon]